MSSTQALGTVPAPVRGRARSQLRSFSGSSRGFRSSAGFRSQATASKVRLGSQRLDAGLFGRARAPQRPRTSTSCSASEPVSTTTEVATWESLRSLAESTPAGGELKQQAELREAGAGLPHTDAKLRLFGQKESDVRVTFYRDTAAWCPYCQKVWMMLEEKEIPYRVERINMRSYGDKPRWFLEKVPSGLLPAMELDGQFVTDSLVLMQMLEAAFPAPRHRAMVPDPATPDFTRANELMRLERQLFGAWCSLIFRPGMPKFGPFGGGSGQARGAFESCLDQMEAAFSADSPWLLGGPHPSLVDLQFVSHVERMLASCLYWKGLKIRGGRWPNIERWFDAFEQRPSYQASTSDYYTHVRDIPPQYGDGYFEDDAETKAAAAALGGDGAAWRLPLSLSGEDLEPLSEHSRSRDEAAAREEAAWTLAGNHAAVVAFACRGAGKRGAKQFQAPLADPYAEPAEEYAAAVDGLLRAVAGALLQGPPAALPAVQSLVTELGGKGSNEAQMAAKCLGYLRDRVGVPRDMSYHAAMQLRAHLNWAIDELAN